MKKFKDLEFKEHPLSKSARKNMEIFKDDDYMVDYYKEMLNHTQARIELNDKSISVIFGKSFYSNGIDTYEMFIYGEDEPRGCLTEDEITEIMIKIQKGELWKQNKRF